MASAKEAGSPTVDFVVSPELVTIADHARDLGLCPECFGRLVGRYGHGLTNPERAERIASGTELPAFAPIASCALCRGGFDRWETWVERIERTARGIEWATFSCGCRWDPEILAHEELIWSKVGTPFGESARSAFNRELGKKVEQKTGKQGGSGPSDVVFVADLTVGRVELTIRPIYLTGRYVKLDRTIPQTRWPCRACKGRGCTRCDGTGKMYPTSVEELIADPVLVATQGRGTRFHGMGREDIDARMLGEGRPFVLEVLAPRVRSIDLATVNAEIGRTAAGRVEVRALAVGVPGDVTRVKEARPSKSYRVVVAGEAAREKINEALKLAVDRAIAQRTPTRVAHRRSDRVRTRRIVTADLVAVDPGRFTLELRAEAGTYIKEWVEGDGGRTEPNLSQSLGLPLHVESLDVIAIHDEET
ncbi:MAG: tRNA pseudouridine(54/55) synthase Pus10 [Thermoplasmata archaeon]|nr:tRNA pseudouridine(54/55) synthase Pus10 [Thermoplasmata archaeon]